MPKVSVWLTSYNHGEFIRESIEGILGQSYKDFELYIVDDCSADNSWDIIQEYAAKDSRIVAIRHPYNQGSSGLYTMVDQLSGEYLAIAHCDDVWCLDKLEKQVKILEENPNTAACFTWVSVIDDDGNDIATENHPYSQLFDKENRTRYEWLNYFFYHGNCLCHPSLLIRRDSYEKYDMFSRGLSGLPDFYQWIRLCKHADIFILPDRLTKFRVHADESNTSGDNRNNLVRVFTEEWFLLKEYGELIHTHEVIDVFPEAKEYLVDGEISEQYALARVFLGYPRNSYKLYGLQLLYELFQDEEELKKAERLYGYTFKSYTLDKQKYDIFHVIPDNRQMEASIYLYSEQGYNEEDKICTDIFVQQTGRFFLKIDLSKYTETMLSCIRIDLDEGRYRRFQIAKCLCGDKKLTMIPVNGKKENGKDVFYTIDPQYQIHMTSGGILYIEGYTEELDFVEVETYFQEMKQQLYGSKRTIARRIKDKARRFLNK